MTPGRAAEVKTATAARPSHVSPEPVKHPKHILPVLVRSVDRASLRVMGNPVGRVVLVVVAITACFVVPMAITAAVEPLLEVSDAHPAIGVSALGVGVFVSIVKAVSNRRRGR